VDANAAAYPRVKRQSKGQQIMKPIKAINPKHQAVVTRLVSWEIKLASAVNAVNERAEEKAFNRAAEIRAELPKREVKAVDKYLLKMRGY
jgi:hypothetical protein